MNKITQDGECLLTRTQGRFVKSHLIPRALTPIACRGEPLVEVGLQAPPLRRFSSWYDNQIVTQAGEDILSAIDSDGIRELRKHRLVWSGWPADMEALPIEHPRFSTEPLKGKIRWVLGLDCQKVRLLLLSLLWRAAVSEKQEMSLVNLEAQEIEALRKAVSSRNPGSWHLFPMHFFQLVSRGPEHNRTPIGEFGTLPPPVHGERAKLVQRVRFFFDGLDLLPLNSARGI